MESQVCGKQGRIPTLLLLTPEWLVPFESRLPLCEDRSHDRENAMRLCVDENTPFSMPTEIRSQASAQTFLPLAVSRAKIAKPWFPVDQQHSLMGAKWFELVQRLFLLPNLPFAGNRLDGGCDVVSLGHHYGRDK